jgi:transcriptional regulator with XRE-family HTH domain
MGLTQKEIGQRLMALRKSKGLSQEDVAKSIRISRPSLAQIELGNRGIDIFELQRLAVVLQFSMDEFLSKDFSQSRRNRICRTLRYPRSAGYPGRLSTPPSSRMSSCIYSNNARASQTWEKRYSINYCISRISITMNYMRST